MSQSHSLTFVPKRKSMSTQASAGGLAFFIAVTLQAAAVDQATAAPPGRISQSTARPSAGARLELFIPRRLRPDDGKYLAWICGADETVREHVIAWAAAVMREQEGWFAELFEPLSAQAIDFASIRGNDPTLERANAVEELVSARNQRAATLFERERTLLSDMLFAAGVAEAEVEAVVAMAVLAREADSIEGLEIFAPQAKPNALRILYTVAPGRSSDADVALRQLAMDYAPHIFALRRSLSDQCIKSMYRGTRAEAEAIARNERPGGVSPVAKVMKPLAGTLARTAALNREVLSLAEAILPEELGKQVQAIFLKETYGLLAVDPFDPSGLVHELLPHVGDDDRAAADDAIVTDREHRRNLRDRALVAFDMAQTRLIERGLARDAVTGKRFTDALRTYHVESERSARTLLRLLESFAVNSDQFDPRRFAERLERWERTGRERLEDLSMSGVISAFVPPGKLQ